MKLVKLTGENVEEENPVEPTQTEINAMLISSLTKLDTKLDDLIQAEKIQRDVLEAHQIWQPELPESLQEEGEPEACKSFPLPRHCTGCGEALVATNGIWIHLSAFYAKTCADCGEPLGSYGEHNSDNPGINLGEETD